jgi:hypothetical protein
MKTIAILLPFLAASAVMAADPRPVVESFAPGQIYREPEHDAPPTVSRMFVRHVDASAAKSSNSRVTLPATGDSGMIVLLLPLTPGGGTHRATATLRTPQGDALRSGDNGSSARGIQRFAVDAAEGLGITVPSGEQEVLHIDRAAAAAYSLSDIQLPADASGMLVVAGEPDSALTMTTTTGPLSHMPGQPVTLQATLRDGDGVVTGAHVIAHLAPSSARTGTIETEVALFDDGTHGDRVANDGVYSASVATLGNEPGFWRARYDASGTTPRGVEFARTGSNEIMNERASARMSNVQSAIDGESLHITANVQVAEPGQYRYDVVVASRRDGSGERRGLAWGEAMRVLDRGTSQLSLDVPVSLLGGAKAEELFLDVRLLSLDVMGLADRITIAPRDERDAAHTAMQREAAQP